MNDQQNKVRTTIWFSPESMKRCDAACVLAGCKSRAEYVERAVNFYAGYLSAENHTTFFAHAISETVSGIIAGAEERIRRLQFKEAVELAKLAQIMAAQNEIDEETMRRLHIKCVEEVKRIGGVIRYEDAVKYQQGE